MMPLAIQGKGAYFLPETLTLATRTPVSAGIFFAPDVWGGKKMRDGHHSLTR
jgi:hypothetical protein